MKTDHDIDKGLDRDKGSTSSKLSCSYPIPMGYFTAQPAKSLVELILGEMGITVIDWDIYSILIY